LLIPNYKELDGAPFINNVSVQGEEKMDSGFKTQCVFILEEKLGVRLIENVLVTETGGEVLSNFTRDLIVL